LIIFAKTSKKAPFRGKKDAKIQKFTKSLKLKAQKFAPADFSAGAGVKRA